MRNLIPSLGMAIGLAFSAPAHANAGEQINAQARVVAQSITTPAAYQRAIQAVATIDKSRNAAMAALAGMTPGTAAYLAQQAAIRQMALTGEAISVGYIAAREAGFRYAELLGAQATLAAGIPVSVMFQIVPSDALIEQMMMGEDYTPQYDSASWDPVGPAGDLGGGSTWFESLFDGPRGEGAIRYASWSDEDPAWDDPGPVALKGITAESEGPLGPLMLEAGAHPFAASVMLSMSATATVLDAPVGWRMDYGDTDIAWIAHADGYVESRTRDGSSVSWHMDYPF